MLSNVKYIRFHYWVKVLLQASRNVLMNLRENEYWGINGIKIPKDGIKDLTCILVGDEFLQESNPGLFKDRLNYLVTVGPRPRGEASVKLLNHLKVEDGTSYFDYVNNLRGYNPDHPLKVDLKVTADLYGNGNIVNDDLHISASKTIPWSF